MIFRGLGAWDGRESDKKEAGGVPFGGEFVLFISEHEGGGKAEGAETEASLGTPADVMNYGDCPLIELFLVVVLVFDHVEIDKVA